jgi:hypothetical protein
MFYAPQGPLLLIGSPFSLAHKQTRWNASSPTENTTEAAIFNDHRQPPSSRANQPLFVKLGELVSALVK